MADLDPETEVVAWLNITLAWLAYHEKFLGDERQADEEERKLLIALIAISTGVKDVREFKVPVEIGQRLLECYDDLGKGMID